MKNLNTKGKLITVCSPLILAGALFHSSAALADVSADCVADGGTSCPSGGNSISDLNPDVVSSITIPPVASCPAGSVTDVNLNLDIEHTWIGDLIVTLTGPDGVTSSTLLDEPGDPALGGLGCNNNNAQPPNAIFALFDDASPTPAEGQCNTPNPAITGTVSPSTLLAVFNGGNADGVWILNIEDTEFADEGQLNNWSLAIACTPPPAANIPTLSFWGLLSMIGGLGIASSFFARRRRKL